MFYSRAGALQGADSVHNAFCLCQSSHHGRGFWHGSRVSTCSALLSHVGVSCSLCSEGAKLTKHSQRVVYCAGCLRGSLQSWYHLDRSRPA